MTTIAAWARKHRREHPALSVTERARELSRLLGRPVSVAAVSSALRHVPRPGRSGRQPNGAPELLREASEHWLRLAALVPVEVAGAELAVMLGAHQERARAEATNQVVSDD